MVTVIVHYSQLDNSVDDFPLFFNRYFEVKTAPENGVLDEASRLRYQVYCLEREFLSRENCVGEQESDHFDAHALHGIVRHRETGLTVAAVRLVRGGGDAPDLSFPLGTAYPDLLLQHGITNQWLPRWNTAEISRFAISRLWRQHVLRRRGQDRDNIPTRAGWRFNGRRYPLVTFGLFVALMRMSVQSGITHWLAIMEPSLLRLLGRFGISFKSIGGLIEYHGWRQPCYDRVDNVLDRVRQAERNLFDLIQHDQASYCRVDRRSFERNHGFDR